jgi:periplasmic copper chaperone A
MLEGSGYRRAAGRAVNATLLLATMSSAALAALSAEPDVTVQNAQVRMVIPSRPAAGYFTLRNNGTAQTVLTGARSPACDSVTLHESVHSGGQEQMLMVKELIVPPGSAISFAPGGLHLMCMRPNNALRPGTMVEMTLNFADGGSLTAPFAVIGASGK